MQSIDNYFGEIYYIRSAFSDPQIPLELKTTLKRDVLKCMAIGSAFMILSRYMIFSRYYLLKNYVNSLLIGSLLGLSYCPVFLGPKIDQYRLTLLL